MTKKFNICGEVGGGALVELAPDLTLPSSLVVTGNPFSRTAIVDPTGALTTILSLPGRRSLEYLQVGSFTAETVTVKLTIDGVVIMNDTFSITVTSLVLIGGATAAGGSTAYLSKSSILLEVETATDTAISADFIARPILE